VKSRKTWSRTSPTRRPTQVQSHRELTNLNTEKAYAETGERQRKKKTVLPRATVFHTIEQRTKPPQRKKKKKREKTLTYSRSQRYYQKGGTRKRAKHSEGCETTPSAGSFLPRKFREQEMGKKTAPFNNIPHPTTKAQQKNNSYNTVPPSGKELAQLQQGQERAGAGKKRKKKLVPVGKVF